MVISCFGTSGGPNMDALPIFLQKVMAPNKMRMLTVNETRFDVLVTSALLPSVAQNGAVM